MSKKMFVDRLDNYKIDNLRIMTKEMCKYNLEMKTCHLEKLLLSRKQNYECVQRLFVFTKHSRKEQDVVHLSKKSPYTFIILF